MLKLRIAFDARASLLQTKNKDLNTLIAHTLSIYFELATARGADRSCAPVAACDDDGVKFD
jgi:hypothetical protein